MMDPVQTYELDTDVLRGLRRGFWPAGLGHSAYRAIKPRLAELAEADFQEHVKHLTKDDVVLDLGANIGKFTKILADSGARVHAFEPDPDTFARLQAEIGSRGNVTLYQAAIGAEAATVRLLRARNYEKDPVAKSLGSSVARTSRFEMDHGNAVDVEQVDLFAFVAALPVRPRLIKMDIEGAEWPIFERIMDGARPCDALFAETHERFAPLRLMGGLNRFRRYAASVDDIYLNPYWG
ncbi:MAG: FkbM family methyltransferase [Roseicyclus sp.]